MKKILLTAFIALGFGFAAMAQQEPLKAKVNKQAVASKKAEKASILKQKIETEKAAQQTAKPASINSSTSDRVSGASKN